MNAKYLIASGGEREVMGGIPLLERSLHDTHSDILDKGSSSGDSSSAGAHARQHQSVPTHESLVHKILSLFAHIREQERPADVGQQGRLLGLAILAHHCNKLMDGPNGSIEGSFES